MFIATASPVLDVDRVLLVSQPRRGGMEAKEPTAATTSAPYRP